LYSDKIGSGKTYISKIFSGLEMKVSGNPPRVLCFDDYFLEEEEEEVDGEIVEVMKYRYDPKQLNVCH
jgi:hypothetical protein